MARLTDIARRLRRALGGFGLACFAVLAMGAERGSCSADPMPSPGKINPGKVLVSISRSQRPGGPIDLVAIIGLPTAAPRVGFVDVRVLPDENELRFRATGDGTFTALLPAASGDRLVLRFRETETGPAGEAIEFTVAAPVEGANDQDRSPLAPETDPGLVAGARVNFEATGVDAGGTAPISGNGYEPGAIVTVGNLRTGAVVELVADTRGSVAGRIAARSGDTLVVIVRSSSNLTSEGATITVP